MLFWCGRMETEVVCEHDWSSACPEKWEAVGNVHGGKQEFCAAGLAYAGLNVQTVEVLCLQACRSLDFAHVQVLVQQMCMTSLPAACLPKSVGQNGKFRIAGPRA